MPVLSRFRQLLSVAALPDFVLEVRFAGGEEKRYDMKPVFAAWPMFEGLRESPEVFGRLPSGPVAMGWSGATSGMSGRTSCSPTGLAKGMHNAECRMQNAQWGKGQTIQRSNDFTIQRCNDPTNPRAMR